MANNYLFTSESVSEGHPDKMADAISDAVVDAVLAQDKRARVAVETLVKTGVAIVAGELTTTASVEFEALIRKTILDIGYDSSDMGYDGASVGVINIIGKQSPDIAQGVDRKDEKKQGAGDQGLMFGYATNETDVLMPAPITLAHRLVKKQAEVRKKGKLPWLRPDAKSQVTLRYEDDRPVGIEAVVLSTQHSDDISTKALREAVIEEILKPVLPTKWIDKRTKYHINPTGRFVIGGPVGDCGLTGRKIIVDTYGGYARHGGGAFSGKDPSKVDRSAAYAARYVAKNIVAAGLAERCEVQVSYAIGVAEPTSIMVETFGTSRLSRERLTQLVRKHFDLTPYGLREMLDLARPIYQKTAAYGHFGRTEPEFIGRRPTAPRRWPPMPRGSDSGGVMVSMTDPAVHCARRPLAPEGRCDRPVWACATPACQAREPVDSSTRRSFFDWSIASMNANMKSVAGTADHKVADLKLADWGRKEIAHRRDRDARPDGDPRGVREAAAAEGRAHHRLAAHDDPDRRADRDAAGARRRGALGLLQHLLDAGPRRRRDRRRRHAGVRRTRASRSTSTGTTPTASSSSARRTAKART